MFTSISWWISADRSYHHRILVFDATQLSNQGAGNLLKGLYAAHLLGREFGRTVCTVYPDLQVFFEPQQLQSHGGTDDCHAFTSTTTSTIGTIQRQQRFHKGQERKQRLVLLDYQVVDECHVQRVLASSVPVVVLSGNTYPRWPHPPSEQQPPLNFFDLYRPRPEFLLRFNDNNGSSSSNSTTTVVVHLRSPDDVTLDPRNGMDEASLRQMERLVQPSTTTDTEVVLVTNNVSLYQRFSQCCHWSHANWTVVAHSANGVVWDGTYSSSSSSTLGHHHSKRRPWRTTSSSSSHDRVQQNMQLWMDWYTIYRADMVYHTRSAFSESAHMWATAATAIEGRRRQSSYLFTVVTATGSLVAQNDDDATTTTLPLSQRRKKDLQHCGVYEQRVRDNEALFRGLDFTK